MGVAAPVRSPDGLWQWDGTAWRPAEVARSRFRRDWPTVVITCVVGIAIWMPTMALTQNAGPPTTVAWVWYLGLMLVAAIVLGALRPVQWPLLGIALVGPQLGLALVTAPRQDAAPWFPIFAVLVLVGLGATGVALLAAHTRRRFARSDPVANPGCWVQSARFVTVAVIGGFALLCFFLWLLMGRPFRDSQEHLRDAAKTFEIGGGRVVADDYVPGSCLTNCPRLEVTYRFDRRVQCRQLTDALRSQGFREVPRLRLDGRRGTISVRYDVVGTRSSAQSFTCALPTDRVRTVRAIWEDDPL